MGDIFSLGMRTLKKIVRKYKLHYCLSWNIVQGIMNIFLLTSTEIRDVRHFPWHSLSFSFLFVDVLSVNWLS